MGEGLINGKIFIDGVEYEVGDIPNLEVDVEGYADFVRDECRRNHVVGRNSDGELTCTFNVKFNPITFYKITGVYDYAYKYCPNRRVAHLMRFGKNWKVRRKNMFRAIDIIGHMLNRKFIEYKHDVFDMEAIG